MKRVTSKEALGKGAGGVMVYLEYEEYLRNYHRAQERFNDVLLEKERLFTQALPSAVRYDKDRVKSSITGNALDRYVIEVDEKKINETLAELRQVIGDRAILLDVKERELRSSKDKSDIVYVCKYLDGMSIGRICHKLNYSRAQVYRIICDIGRSINTFSPFCKT